MQRGRWEVGVICIVFFFFVVVVFIFVTVVVVTVVVVVVVVIVVVSFLSLHPPFHILQPRRHSACIN
jgi:hypothetical protein